MSNVSKVDAVFGTPVVATSAAPSDGAPAAPSRLAMLVYRLLCLAFCHMLPLKLAFALLRRVRPLALVRGTLWLTKADDVREVLGRFDDFHLAQVIEPGMPWGQFIMTIDWREQHAVERGLLQSAVRLDDDRQAITALVTQICDDQIRQADGGRIDVVAALAEPVVVRIAADYFGVAPLNGSAQKMADAMADLAGIIMVNPPAGSAPWARSREAMAGVTQQILAQIASCRAMLAAGRGAQLPDNLLTRLVRLQAAGGQPAWFDDDWIRRYLTGLIATGGATIVRATAHAVDQLLAHPHGLQLARDAAARLDRAPQDAAAAAALQQLVYEALRFRPMLPLLVRDCPRDTVIAGGTPRARIVPGGTRVIAAPLAAMFDAQKVPAPSEFRADRPQDAYVLFGVGVRSCFGRYIADIVLLQIARALLRLPALARAPGEAGEVRYEGPAPRSLTVTFSSEVDPGSREDGASGQEAGTADRGAA
ncbi:cytochrome P450 [Bradyrhizobium sp. 2TAF24]|uniref:cytochrome P450 n=1 Tax=Bradyrhizobium sp. 2TAF24 TaxID=3233011 RepID=UPI003F8DE672